MPCAEPSASGRGGHARARRPAPAVCHARSPAPAGVQAMTGLAGQRQRACRLAVQRQRAGRHAGHASASRRAGQRAGSRAGDGSNSWPAGLASAIGRYGARARPLPAVAPPGPHPVAWPARPPYRWRWPARLRACQPAGAGLRAYTPAGQACGRGAAGLALAPASHLACEPARPLALAWPPRLPYRWRWPVRMPARWRWPAGLHARLRWPGQLACQPSGAGLRACRPPGAGLACAPAIPLALAWPPSLPYRWRWHALRDWGAPALLPACATLVCPKHAARPLASLPALCRRPASQAWRLVGQLRLPGPRKFGPEGDAFSIPPCEKFANHPIYAMLFSFGILRIFHQVWCFFAAFF